MLKDKILNMYEEIVNSNSVYDIQLDEVTATLLESPSALFVLLRTLGKADHKEERCNSFLSCYNYLKDSKDIDERFKIVRTLEYISLRDTYLKRSIDKIIGVYLIGK